MLPSGPSITSADINISAAGGAGYTLLGQSPSEGFVTFRVQFFANDAGSGAGVPVIGVPTYVKVVVYDQNADLIGSRTLRIR